MVTVTKYFGKASLVGGITSWAILFASLLWGGLDPSISQAPILKAATVSALVIAFFAFILGLIALVRGPDRVFGALGLVLALLFLLYFTGFIFVILP